MARLAPLSRRLARKIRAYPLGLRRDYPPPGRHERVDLIVHNATSEKQARKILSRANALSKNVRFHRWPTNRVWTRDSGCTFVLNGGHVAAGDSPRKSRLSAVTWRFNAWAKYSNYQHDEKIGNRMAKPLTLTQSVRSTANRGSCSKAGPSTSTDAALLLTTEECLLSKTQQRNSGMSGADYEKLFSTYLGIKKVIWLGSGVTGDDTHGHVDDITRFISPGTVVTAVETNAKDANHQPLRENLRRLRAATDQSGKRLNVVELPMPVPVIFEGRRLPASYANFYIANGIVLVPVFNDPNDRVALDILSGLFPRREVVGIYSGDLIWGFGAMHCMTQQQPVG